MIAKIRFASVERLRKAAFSMLLLLASMAVPVFAHANSAIPAGKGSYQELVGLFDEFLAFREAADARADYSAAAVAGRRERMQQFQQRIDDMNVASWNRARQVDYLAVRSRLDQYDFTLQRLRPWARDPGFYVDEMLWVTFAELPLEGQELEEFLDEIRAIPALVEAARNQLDDVAADYADLAIHNLNHADGVGHGHPYREVPPAGVLGWYDDLLERAAAQPELLADIAAAPALVPATTLPAARASRIAANSGDAPSRLVNRSWSPPEMKIFSPVICQWSPAGVARVPMLERSEPAPGRE